MYCLLLFFIPFLSIYNIYLRKLAPHRRLLATAKAPGKSSKREQFISFFFFFFALYLSRSICFLLQQCGVRSPGNETWKGHAHIPLEARKVRQPKAIRKRIGKQNVETKEKLDKRLFIFLFSISSLSAYSVAALNDFINNRSHRAIGATRHPPSAEKYSRSPTGFPVNFDLYSST